MSILGDLQNIILPPLPDKSNTTAIAIFVGGFAGGYFLLSPYFGAEGMLASALVGWATSRSVYKLAVAEKLSSTLGGTSMDMARLAVNAAIPLGVMYYAAGMYPMVDLSSSLMVYGSYVLGAYATMKLL